MFVVERSSSPYLNHFIQPDTIIPDPTNPQSWNRYSYVLNNPVRFNDPSGHMISDDEDGGLTATGFKYVIETKYDANVKGKWSQKELKTLYDTLEIVLKKFDNNIRAYRNAFGSLTFQMVPDPVVNLLWSSGQMAETDPESGVIQISHSTIPWSEGYYGAAGWSISHEMGHVFDFKGSDGDPNAYFSNVFVKVFNNRSCWLGPNGCLGDKAWLGYKLQNFGLGIGNYRPSGSNTDYGLHISSTEDFAESFAGYIFNGTGNSWIVDDDRKNIIQTDIAVIVSYSQ